MRILVALAIVLVAPMPAFAAGDDPLTIPTSRDGDVATFTAFSAGYERSVVWRGPLETVEDAFGTPRLVYHIDSETTREGGWRYEEGDGDVRIEVGTGHVLDRAQVWTRTTRANYVPFVTEDRIVEEGMSRTGVNEVELLVALQGRTIAPGDAFTVQAARAPWLADDSHRTSISFVALGWQQVGGESVFVLHGDHRWGDDIVVHYRAGQPVPALVQRTTLHGDGTVDVRQQRLLSFSPGHGEALADAAYVPPAWRAEVPGAPRAALTADGPAEAFSTRHPLSMAVAAARLDPRVAAWLVAHPTAYVMNGDLDEPSGRPVSTWSIYFGEPGALDRLQMTVERALPLPAVVTSVTPGSGWYGMGPALEDAVAAPPQACAGTAEAAALRALGLEMLPVSAGRQIRFDTYRDGGPHLYCEVSLEVTRAGDALGEERRSWARAQISGTTGAPSSAARIDTRVERETDVFLVPFA